MSLLQKALNAIIDKAKNETEKGNAFESLSKIFLEKDDTQVQQYSEVWHYSDWAKNRENYENKDIGIDLVAKLRDEEGYCAVQCKFYEPDHSISKSDLDSFISASATLDFKRLILIDTSLKPISKHAATVFNNLDDKEYLRIQKSELEESRIDWLSFVNDGDIRLRSKKELRDHQIKALEAVKEGLEKDDRGKMIMACGTGKTLTSLRIAEEIAGEGKLVLYMVPSLALMSQTIREWKNDANNDFIAFSACSDEKVGRRRPSDDIIEISLQDLAIPATTDTEKLSKQIQIKKTDDSKMIVVFSTYQSIDVISKSQSDYGLGEFDLIICDEAHRTTGATLQGGDESHFVRIHNNDYIKGKKRLYMTATQRIYGESARKKEEEGHVILASMDDKNQFGKTLYELTFGDAVERDLLTDYKVVILKVDEQVVSDNLLMQKSGALESELKLDDLTKMVGCYKALAKIGINEGKKDIKEDNKPMKRALAFLHSIAISKLFAEEFPKVIDDYNSSEQVTDEHRTDLNVQMRHVDGTFNADERNAELNWLKGDMEKDDCRVLTNVRCLSEGVDVPALDAVIFLHPRKSRIEIVQSVGRVMRKSKDNNKKLGYVILPIVMAPGVTPENALHDNDRYRVIWQVLNALRSHDERIDNRINRMELGEDVSDHIEVIDATKANVSVTDDVNKKSANGEDSNDDIEIGDEEKSDKKTKTPEQLNLHLTDLSSAIMAKIVQKCGTRDYWEKWANDISDIALKHITRINSIVKKASSPERKVFMDFLEEIRDDLNPEISENDAIEMLAQHIITRPVFETLFRGNKFASDNAVSKAMEKVLDKIYDYGIKIETESLEKFYESVERQAGNLTNAKSRQALILKLYDRFFKNAFPLMTQKLGIVYTPVEIVDFIIHSVEGVMKDEFGSSLGNENVHILDPFSGTGTFITRLLQLDILSREQIRKKYKNEIHANEVVLLAYYIACINIETVYEDLIKENKYQQFNGMVLTDTFQLYEQERDMIADLLPDNSQRRTAQKNRDITVILGNPPYSAGQSSANDNAENIDYPNLDARIEETYASSSVKSTNVRDLYNSYIRAFRWASDRLNQKGVIAFVTGSGWVDKTFARGMRKHLAEKFTSIYVVNLRGDIRKNMFSNGAAGEGENIFGEGSTSGIAITILVKKENKSSTRIFYNDIGENKTFKEKRDFLTEKKHIYSIKNNGGFYHIQPDEEFDWINQGDKKFSLFMKIGDKKNNKNEKIIFKSYSLGLATGRDTWCYNFSRQKLEDNISKFIDYYNAEVVRFKKYDKGKSVKEFVGRDLKKISWNDNAFQHLEKGISYSFDSNNIYNCCYRPFTKINAYFSRQLNARTYQNYKIFPYVNAENLVIIVSGIGAQTGFSVFMSDRLCDLNILQASQCFPLKIYEETNIDGGLFQNQSSAEKYHISDGISDECFKQFLDSYPEEKLTKEDIFYYIYGLLHSNEYRKTFYNNLLKETPRIPTVRYFKDFMTFSKSGRKLSTLHINYETANPYPVTFKEGDLRLANITDPALFYRVEKMKFVNKSDKSTVIYNKNITIKNIPLEAYEYVINGKSALNWVMERQSFKSDKASGIVNDINDYANETMQNPAYPLELFQRVITVSLETMKIVRGLPELDIG